MKVPDAHFTEREGVQAVGAIFAKLKWLFRPQPTSDFGIDAHVETVEDGKATGRLLALQIKAGSSYLRPLTGDHFVYRGDMAHLDYWTAHSLPVILVLYDPDSQTAYWAHISQSDVTRTNKGWRINVPHNQKLARSALGELQQLAAGGRYVLRLRRLQLERPWMEALREGNRLFLEVDEWVNKLSGRGDFRLTIQDPDGEEHVDQTWPFQIFPGIPYEELLSGLFPWADAQVDEDFYEPYEEPRYQEEVGIWDSEDQKYILMETYSDWAKRHDWGLRPYEEDGEIARWRVELTLNAVGEAFLHLDDFLSGREQPETP